jgi:hypothetical protein
MTHTAARIADAIFSLVERAGEPVTLARIAREIPGFAAVKPPAYSYSAGEGSARAVFWGGMTEAGADAFRIVVAKEKVAVAFVSPLVYLKENAMLADPDWQPIVLVPARMATLATMNGLFCVLPELFTPAIHAAGWQGA